MYNSCTHRFLVVVSVFLGTEVCVLGTVIYADSLLAVNFSMDFLALYIAARLLHAPLRPLRLAAGALIGAVFALAAVVTEAYIYGSAWMAAELVLSGIFAVIMCACAFGHKRVFGTALTYGAVNIGLGGIMTALYSFVGRISDTLGAVPVSTSPSASPPLFGVIALVSGAVSLLYGKFRWRSGAKRRINVTVWAFGCEFSAELLCDSGNLLCDPYSGKPVVIISCASLQGILPTEIIQAARMPERITSLSEAAALRVRLIPAGSVTGQGMLLGFTPERLCIEGRETDAVVAIGTDITDYGGSDGIIPQTLITI